MKTNVKALCFLVTVITAVVCQQIYAQEFGGGANPNEPTPVATEPVPITIDANDPGIAVVYQSQESKLVYDPNETSARNYLEMWVKTNGHKLGWDPTKKRFLSLEHVFFKTEAPASDRNFLVNRDIAARRAALRGKVRYIRFIATKMSASEQFETPGTDVYSQLNTEYEGIRQRLETLRQEVVKLLEQVNKAEAEALAGATTQDRINALLDAAITRLGVDFDSGKVAIDKQERFERIKAEYQNAKTQYDTLLQEANNVRGKVISEWKSSIVSESQMAVTGATVLHQYESWDKNTKQYEVAVLLCWSPQLELAARATLTNEPIDFKGAVGKYSLDNWLNDQDLSAMVGPRSFLDDRGQRHFLGISSRPYIAYNGDLDERQRESADAEAEAMVGFSLFADVLNTRSAKLIAQNILSDDLDEDTTITKIVETLDQLWIQSYKEMNTHGVQPVRRTRVNHFLTGVDMHVSVYAISADEAASAMKIQEESARTAIAINKNQEWKRGRNEEIRRQIQAAQNDPASRRAGEAAGNTAVKIVPETHNRTQDTMKRSNTIQGTIGSGGPVDEDW